MLNIRLDRLLYMSDIIAILDQMRASSGNADTIGLSNEIILDFAARDQTLVQAIEEAEVRQKSSQVSI